MIKTIILIGDIKNEFVTWLLQLSIGLDTDWFNFDYLPVIDLSSFKIESQPSEDKF